MTHASKRNSKGELITHDSKGRAKDPDTWMQLDEQAWAKKGQAPPWKGGGGGGSAVGGMAGALGSLGISGPPGLGAGAEGEEWAPLKASPGAIWKTQKRLVDAGLLDPKEVQMGTWGVSSAQAYRVALDAAQGSGLFVDQILRQWSKGGGLVGAGQEGPTQEPLVIRLTHPEEVKAIVNQVAVRSIGRKLSDPEVSAFTGAFHNMQRDAQRKLYQASGSGLPGGPGGEVVEPPDPTVIAQQQVPEQHPQEAASYGMVGRYGEFLELLHGVGG